MCAPRLQTSIVFACIAVPRLHSLPAFTLITMSTETDQSRPSISPSSDYPDDHPFSTSHSDEWSTSEYVTETVEAVDNVIIINDTKPLPPLPILPRLPRTAVSPFLPLPPPPTRSSSFSAQGPVVILPPLTLSPPSKVPRTPLPPPPSVRAAIPAAMCETPAFLPPTSPSPEEYYAATPPVSPETYDASGGQGNVGGRKGAQSAQGQGEMVREEWRRRCTS